MNDKIQSLSLSILFYVIICGAAELEYRLEKLESLVQEQLKDRKSLDRRLDALKTSIADLNVRSFHARTISGAQADRHKENIRTTFSRLPFEIDFDGNSLLIAFFILIALCLTTSFEMIFSAYLIWINIVLY